MVLVVAALGQSGSGKTVTLEYLVRCFSSEGYRVGVVKHVHHRGFTIDTEGKNTWRYAQAGAKVIAAVSPDEVAIIKKTLQETEGISQVLDALRGEGLDVIFIEGYHGLIANRVDVLKILTAKDVKLLEEMLMEGIVEPVLAVSGLVAKNYEGSYIGKYPVVKIPEEGQILVDLIKQQLKFEKEKEAPACE